MKEGGRGVRAFWKFQGQGGVKIFIPPIVLIFSGIIQDLPKILSPFVIPLSRIKSKRKLITKICILITLLECSFRFET